MAPSPPSPEARAALQHRLFEHLLTLAQPRHARWSPLGLLTVRGYVREQLGRWGAVEEHGFGQGSDRGTNLILRLPGREPALEPLLVAAHYDGPLQSPGADDNASAVAALLELARTWSDAPPRRPVWLVAFDQEEWGMLGSRALAGELRSQQVALALMVSLEMLGYTAEEQRYPLPGMELIYGARGDFIAVVGNLDSRPVLEALRQRMNLHVRTQVLPVPLRGRLLPEVRLSDHSSFWDEGYDAVMVTDTSFLRNPHYHKPTDTVATLDLPFLAAVTAALADGLAAL